MLAQNNNFIHKVEKPALSWNNLYNWR